MIKAEFALLPPQSDHFVNDVHLFYWNFWVLIHVYHLLFWPFVLELRSACPQLETLPGDHALVVLLVALHASEVVLVDDVVHSTSASARLHVAIAKGEHLRVLVNRHFLYFSS